MQLWNRVFYVCTPFLAPLSSTLINVNESGGALTKTQHTDLSMVYACVCVWGVVCVWGGAYTGTEFYTCHPRLMLVGMS